MAAEPHSHEHVHDGDPGHIHDIPVETSIHRSYAPARLVCVGIALYFGAIGVIGLNEMGLNFGDLTSARTEVAGLWMTPLMALILLAIAGVSLVCAAVGPMSRAWMLVMGSMLLAAGLVVIARPLYLHDYLGMNRTNGIAFAVAGGAAIASVIGTPITWARRNRVGRRDVIAA